MLLAGYSGEMWTGWREKEAQQGCGWAEEKVSLEAEKMDTELCPEKCGNSEVWNQVSLVLGEPTRAADTSPTQRGLEVFMLN